MPKKLIFTIINDSSYDQRMIRICTSLSNAGYHVLLVGRKDQRGKTPPAQSFGQKLLYSPFNSGPLLYAYFNIRLFFFLLAQKADLICAIDLDTILPCYWASRLKKTARVYDAHELFCEMKEVATRPRIYKIWKKIERFAVPRYPHGYTVNGIIAATFQDMYAVNYHVIRNIPKEEPERVRTTKDSFIIYQGAVNEGRSFETLIPAMKWVRVPLHIYGDGNYLSQAKDLVKQNGLEAKVIFKGKIAPPALKEITPRALLGLTLFDDTAASNYNSLANRFFDYMHAGIPQICVDYPAYREINNLYNIAVLTRDLSSENLAVQINRLLQDKQLYATLAENCVYASQSLNWQSEEKKLIAFYHEIIPASP